MIDPKIIKSVASQERHHIFVTLKLLPHDSRYLGYLVTCKAKELGLISEEKANLKGNTVDEWTTSLKFDGKNTPNAWACTAAVRLLVDFECYEYFKSAPYAFAYYFDPTGEMEENMKQLRLDPEVFNGISAKSRS